MHLAVVGESVTWVSVWGLKEGGKSGVIIAELGWRVNQGREWRVGRAALGLGSMSSFLAWRTFLKWRIPRKTMWHHCRFWVSREDLCQSEDLRNGSDRWQNDYSYLLWQNLVNPLMIHWHCDPENVSLFIGLLPCPSLVHLLLTQLPLQWWDSQCVSHSPL